VARLAHAILVDGGAVLAAVSAGDDLARAARHREASLKRRIPGILRDARRAAREHDGGAPNGRRQQGTARVDLAHSDLLLRRSQTTTRIPASPLPPASGRLVAKARLLHFRLTIARPTVRDRRLRGAIPISEKAPLIWIKNI